MMAGSGIQPIDLAFLRELLYVSDLRGGHGTGVVQGFVSQKSKIQYLLDKKTFTAGFYLWFNEYSKDGNRNILDGVGNNFFMGHVRFATTGTLSEENCHPFEFDKLIGMHNGTLRNERFSNHKDKTDSELLFNEMNSKGIKETLETLDDDDAYAVQIFNKTTGKITIARNDKRPLFICWHKKRNVMYVASEAEMLEFCAKRKNLDITETFAVDAYKLFEFHPLDVKAGNTKWSRLEPIEKKKKTVTYHMKGNKSSIVPWDEGDKDLTTLLLEDKSIKESAKDNLLTFPTKELQKKTDEESSKNYKIIGNRFKVLCKICNEPMDLYKQYMNSKKNEPNNFNCDNCNDLIKDMQDRLNNDVRVN